MALSSGSRLGPYLILEPLGAGGMGEVYRARDTRLEREVAVKVLPELVASDPDALARFGRETRAVAALSHPNILAIHDVGTVDRTAYAVMELLQGETLRERLAQGALPVRKALDYAAQIARGLAAAHDKGIVHRDLKPENLFVTSGGHLKILDFGLARQAATLPGADDTSSPTLSRYTGHGVILGTVGYMSPEQVRGQTADHRSDIFAFGCVLYEMLAGRRAFRKDTPADTMSAILREEPPELSGAHLSLTPALDRIVRHCLEKDPELRFQSARDLAFHLDSLAGDSGPSLVGSRGLRPSGPVRRMRVPLAAAGLLLVGAVAGWLGGSAFSRGRGAAPPSFTRLTFRRGALPTARFAPDGQTVVYGAAWDADPLDVFSTRIDSRESRSLGLRGAHLLAVSSTGQLAVLLRPRRINHYVTRGTLAQVALAGGPPRERAENVEWADWSPDGSDLAIVRWVSGKSRLEYPIGTLRYETGGWISHPRISPDGRRVAFLDHPMWGNATARLVVAEPTGPSRSLTGHLRGALGLAWPPGGDEVWFTRRRLGIGAVSLAGRLRPVSVQIGLHTLLDVSREGRVLVTQESWRAGLMWVSPGEERERDFSELDWSLVRALSSDGRTLAFDESADGGGPLSSFYLRHTDGSPAVRLGDGIALALSPDKSWVLSSKPYMSPPQLRLVPVAAGQERRAEKEGLSYEQGAFLPDGRRVVVAARAPGQALRLYVQDVSAATAPVPISPEGIVAPQAPTVSPDGRSVIALGPDERAWSYAVDGTQADPLPGLVPGEVPVRFSEDGRTLYAYDATKVPGLLFRLDLQTGARVPFRTLLPPDPAGVVRISPVLLDSGARACAYSYRRILSDLYVLEGLK